MPAARAPSYLLAVLAVSGVGCLAPIPTPCRVASDCPGGLACAAGVCVLPEVVPAPPAPEGTPEAAVVAAPPEQHVVFLANGDDVFVAVDGAAGLDPDGTTVVLPEAPPPYLAAAVVDGAVVVAAATAGDVDLRWSRVDDAGVIVDDGVLHLHARPQDWWDLSRREHAVLPLRGLRRSRHRRRRVGRRVRRPVPHPRRGLL